MANLFKIGLAVAEIVTVRMASGDHRRMRAVIFGLAAAVCGVAAAVCGLTSIWLYAIPRVGPAGAPLVVGCVLLVAAAGVAVSARLGRQRRPIQVQPEVSAQMLLDETARLTRAHQVPMLLAALVAGLEVGRHAK